MRDGAPELLGSLNPLADDNLHVGDCSLVGFSIGRAAREFRHLGNEGLVVRFTKALDPATNFPPDNTCPPKLIIYNLETNTF